MANDEILEPITRATRLRLRDVFNEETREAYHVIGTKGIHVLTSGGKKFTIEELMKDFKVKPEPDRMESVLFCCLYFASGDSSSWGEPVMEGHCFNCGAGGTTFSIPRYAVQSIREQASWVGKRYYPSEEDLENREERKRLLASIENFPGRTVEPAMELDRDGNEVREEGRWNVKQATPGNLWSSTSVTAETEEEAWEKAKLCGLTYYDEESLR